MIAQQDPELFVWLQTAAGHFAPERPAAGSFLQTVAEAAFRADAENYPILRPALLELKAKYPQYADEEKRVRVNLDALRTMTSRELMNLALAAADEGDRPSFWLLSGALASRLDFGSTEFKALWNAAHEKNGSFDEAVRIVRRMRKEDE